MKHDVNDGTAAQQWPKSPWVAVLDRGKNEALVADPASGCSSESVSSEQNANWVDLWCLRGGQDPR